MFLVVRHLVSRVSSASFSDSLANMNSRTLRFIAKKQIRVVLCTEDISARGFAMWGDGLQVDMRNPWLGIGCANYIVFNPQLNMVYVEHIVMAQLTVCKSRICIFFLPQSALVAVERMLFHRPASRL